MTRMDAELLAVEVEIPERATALYRETCVRRRQAKTRRRMPRRDPGAASAAGPGPRGGVSRGAAAHRVAAVPRRQHDRGVGGGVPPWAAALALLLHSRHLRPLVGAIHSVPCTPHHRSQMDRVSGCAWRRSATHVLTNPHRCWKGAGELLPCGHVESSASTAYWAAQNGAKRGVPRQHRHEWRR